MAIEPLLGTRAQKGFIGTITVQALIVLAMVAIVFHKVNDHVDFSMSRYRTLPCYLALFALAELFELFMAIDALRLRSVIQLFGILAFHLAILVFSAIQVPETRTALIQFEDCDSSVNYVSCDGQGTLYGQILPFLIVVPCVIAASLMVMVFWVKQLFGEFGWAIFHIVGANPKMKSMYEWYQIMICLLKFDFFSFTGVTMQLLIVVLSDSSAEFAVTIAAIPIVLILLAICGFAVQREIKLLMGASLVLMLAAQSYFYKLVRFFEPSSRAQYESVRASLTFFTIVAFTLLFATFAVGLRCFSDFDKGLFESKTSKVSTRQYTFTGVPVSQSGPGGAPLGPRISIE